MIELRFYAGIGLALLALTAAPIRADQVQALRIAAAPTARVIAEHLAREFRANNPATPVEVVASTSGGVAALSADAADVAIVDRAAWELERRPFRQMYGHEPLGLVIARSQLAAPAPVIYVHNDNPLAELSLAQIRRVFATGLTGGDIARWAQLGVQGNLASRAIHAYGLPDDGGFATNLRLREMPGAQFAAHYEPRPDRDAVVAAVASDAAGIAITDAPVMPLPSGVRAVELADGKALEPPLMLYMREADEGRLSAPVAAFVRMAKSNRNLGALTEAARSDPVSPPQSRYRTANGAIRIIGTNTMEGILTAFNAHFARTHPGVLFKLDLRKGMIAAGALTYGTSPFVPMPRELTARELDPYREINGAEPLAIRIAHGSIIKQDRTATLSVYVNKGNPLPSLTAEQVSRIFTTGHPKGDITNWGQLGLTGRWANLPIHTVGMPEDSGFGSFIAGRYSQGRHLSPRQTMRLVSTEVLDVVGGDEAAIGFSATNFGTPRTRAVPIAPDGESRPLTGTADEVTSGRYPLDRFIYLYVRKLPGQRIEPWVAEYLRLVLSREGQAIIAAEPEGFLPLNPSEVAQELAKLDQV